MNNTFSFGIGARLLHSASYSVANAIRTLTPVLSRAQDATPFPNFTPPVVSGSGLHPAVSISLAAPLHAGVRNANIRTDRSALKVFGYPAFFFNSGRSL